jgi:hypothetical protein
MANYYTPIIKLLQWITRSPAGVTACGGLVLSHDQDRALGKTLEAWRHIRKPTYKQSKHEAVDHNRLEKMQHRNHWTSVIAVVNALRDVVLPRLNVLTKQKSLSDSDKIEYFELLMFAIIVTRPCRPCTYYSAYVQFLCAHQKEDPNAHSVRSVCIVSCCCVCAAVMLGTGH